MAKKKTSSRSLILRPVDLPAKKRALIQVATPPEFIKERPGKGNKTFRYIEGGYVIARLNQIFSPIGWDFEVINQQIEQTEVIIRGRLTVKDFETGFSIGKTRTGTHPRVAGVPLGDAIKAAETDSLKKCASHYGIGLDVYWQQLDQDKLTNGSAKKVDDSATKKTTQKAKDDLLKLSIEKISKETDPTLLAQYRDRIEKSTLYSENQKKMLYGAIDGKLKTYAKGSDKKEQSTLV